MKRSRFTEEQIIGVLADQERGEATGEVCRRHGISQTTFFRWKAKYGGMDVSDARKLKTLETENARRRSACLMRLKKLLAEAMLDKVVLKDLLGASPPRHRFKGLASR